MAPTDPDEKTEDGGTTDLGPRRAEEQALRSLEDQIRQWAKDGEGLSELSLEDSLREWIDAARRPAFSAELRRLIPVGAVLWAALLGLLAGWFLKGLL